MGMVARMPRRRSASVAFLVAALTGLATPGVDAVTLRSHTAANPIRKVVNLLQMMQKKIEEEGQAKEALFDKFMCYCKTGDDDLKKSIAAAEDRIPQLESSIEQATALQQQLKEALKQHKEDRMEAKKASETAEALNDKESKAFAQDSSTLKSNINALNKAVVQLEKGMSASSFLQTGTANVLRRLSLSLDMASSDRDLLSAFLAGGEHSAEGQAYAPQSGEITGILKQLGDEMSKELEQITEAEQSRVSNHESLMAAKQKEIVVSTKAIEDKTGRAGDVAVQLTSLAHDLEDTEQGLEEDKKFLANMETSCKTKRSEWAVYQKTQGEELVAIAESIKVLNNDDSLDLFKKTLPSPGVSFLQVSMSAKELRSRAAEALKVRGDPRLDLLQMALRGQQKGFDEVTAKIDELISILGNEQQDDDSKKTFCLAQLDKTEDEKRAQERGVSDAKTVIASTKDSLKEVEEGIQALMLGIKELDKQVSEATATRKSEHEATVNSLASNGAAKRLLELAKNRLYKFYNKALYKAPAKPELSAEDRIASKLQDDALVQLRGDSAPETDLTYKKQGQESSGVLALLDLLKADLSKQITEMETEEKDSQADYEALLKDASEKRALDSKALADKEGAKSELEAALLKDTESLKSQKDDLAMTEKEIAGLHGSCDWLLQNYELRKQARASEADALQKAKAVLSGADYGF